MPNEVVWTSWLAGGKITEYRTGRNEPQKRAESGAESIAGVERSLRMGARLRDEPNELFWEGHGCALPLMRPRTQDVHTTLNCPRARQNCHFAEELVHRTRDLIRCLRDAHPHLILAQSCAK